MTKNGTVKSTTKPRRKKQCGYLADDVTQQSNGAEFGSFVFGDEDAAEWIIAEARTDSQAVEHRTPIQYKANQCASCPGAEYGDQRQQQKPRAEMTELADSLGVIAYAEPYAAHETA